MNRRQFISTTGATLLSTAVGTKRLLGAAPNPAAGSGVSWHRSNASKLFDWVAFNGQPLLDLAEGVGLFDGFGHLLENGRPGAEVRLGPDQPNGQYGPIQMSLTHELR